MSKLILLILSLLNSPVVKCACGVTVTMFLPSSDVLPTPSWPYLKIQSAPSISHIWSRKYLHTCTLLPNPLPLSQFGTGLGKLATEQFVNCKPSPRCKKSSFHYITKTRFFAKTNTYHLAQF